MKTLKNFSISLLGFMPLQASTGITATQIMKSIEK